MKVARQEPAPRTVGRSNQKARTRTALLRAAVELVREGSPPSIPDAAERALVSAATAYRYFSSADDLWWEASSEAVVQPKLAETFERIESAGTDIQARLEAGIRSNGFAMFDDQLPFRQSAKHALDQSLRQVGAPDNERFPVRQGRRNEIIAKVVAPLGNEISKRDLDRIAHALGLVFGTDAMIALLDGVGLDAPAAKEVLLDASRWLLAGALAELTDIDGPG